MVPFLGQAESIVEFGRRGDRGCANLNTGAAERCHHLQKAGCNQQLQIDTACCIASFCLRTRGHASEAVCGQLEICKCANARVAAQQRCIP